MEELQMPKKTQVEKEVEYKQRADEAVQALKELDAEIFEAERRFRSLQAEADRAKEDGNADLFTKAKRDLRIVEDDLEVRQIRRTKLASDAETARSAFWAIYTDSHDREIRALCREYDERRQDLFRMLKTIAESQNEYLETKGKYNPEDTDPHVQLARAILRTCDEHEVRLPEDVSFFAHAGIMAPEESTWLSSVLCSGQAMTEQAGRESWKRMPLSTLSFGKNRLR